MNDIQSTLGSKGLVVIGVNVDHDHALAQEFLQSTNPQFKIVFDPEGKIASQFDIKDMPTSVLIGRDGKIRSTHNGFFPDREGAYFADITTLLKENAP
jgi:peroxiredoxin